MNMVRFDRQFDYLPSLLLTFLLNKPLTLFTDQTSENRLTPLGSPNRMVENKMHPLLRRPYRLQTEMRLPSSPLDFHPFYFS